MKGPDVCPVLVRSLVVQSCHLYRQSIPFARFLFAATAAEKHLGQEVVIDGWFHRGLRPYVEMSRLSNQHGKNRHAYWRWIQYALAGIASVVGWLWLLE